MENNKELTNKEIQDFWNKPPDKVNKILVGRKMFELIDKFIKKELNERRK